MGREGDKCEVLKKMKVRRVDEYYRREREWRLIGDFCRENYRREHYMMETELVGKRAKGRQKMKMFDWMRKRLNEQKKTWGML